MVVRLRCQRWGRRNRPFYRIVAADQRAPRDGKFIEIVSAACGGPWLSIRDPLHTHDMLLEYVLRFASASSCCSPQRAA